MPKKYDPELKARAVRMVTEALPDHPNPTSAVRHVAALLGIGVEALRTWYRQAQIHTGAKPGVTTDIAEENRRLRRENAELRKANEVLKAASIFFAKELDQPRTK